MLKILIVEDVEIILNGIAENLENQGYAVFKAPTGKEALSIVREQNPQLIILDLYLPDMSGLQILKEAKAFNSKICVMILTGFDVETTKEKAFEMGADYVLIKPIPPGLLEEKIAEATKTITENAK